jgi:hypothetical protein
MLGSPTESLELILETALEASRETSPLGLPEAKQLKNPGKLFLLHG